MVGLMHDRFPFSTVPPPTDFDRLCGDGGYLALIHADGNSIGRRIAERQAACGHAKGTLGYEAATEQWFHRMRVAMRQALVTALTRTYAGATDKDYQFRPYQFLMLGGDDVLLACRAADALRLVRDLCLALDDDALRMIDGDPLTLGIGVAIARPSFPLYRLHAVAESLAASAKRLFRQRDALQLPRRSVVDWSIVTASWTDDPLALRRERDLVERDCEVLALSARPYPVVGVADGKGALDNLVGLLAAAEAVGESKTARNQWQQLALDLRRGRHWGELRMRELPAETRAAFAAVGIDSPWIPLGAEHGQPGGRGRWLTPLLDLIEMIEIRQLGRTVASAEGEEG